MILNSVLLSSALLWEGLCAPVQAARMLTPGAITSGFRISGVKTLGPRLEKAATRGADGEVSVTVPLDSILAVAVDGDDLTYSRIMSPSGATTGTRFWPGGSPEYKEVPVKVLRSPSVTTAGNSLSIVEAPTVKIHGAVLLAVYALGPSFPAAQTTITPFFTAPKPPIAMGSSEYGLSEAPPIESESTSTPSLTA
nr:hypothetical protein CKAN_02524200 [Ipomoea batatas]